MDQVREPLRYSHYARSTKKTYCQWILRYIYFYEEKRHPKDMGGRKKETGGREKQKAERRKGKDWMVNETREIFSLYKMPFFVCFAYLVGKKNLFAVPSFTR